MRDKTSFSIEHYLIAAESTGVFRPQEINILEELISDCLLRPGVNYYKIDAVENDMLAGFAVFGRAPLTESSWDLYWLVVHSRFQQKGIGRKLIRDVTERIKSKSTKALVRVETSTREEYDYARKFYDKAGFALAGCVPDFYAQGDGLLIYYKNI